MTITTTSPEIAKSVIPNVGSDVFESNPRSRFWIGKLATGTSIENPEIYYGVATLRANVYIDEMKFLDESHRSPEGYEQDEYDQRSIHFGVAENNGDLVRVVGSGRLVQKTLPGEKLPIEVDFPEVFENVEPEPGAVEVSRFISRHEKDYVQHLIALSVIRTMTLYSVEHGIPADYCIIEQPLFRLLSAIGLPMTVLGEPKILEDYGKTKNIPVRIDPHKVIESVTMDVQGKQPLTKFFKDEEFTVGQGYYGPSLKSKAA